MLGLVRTGLVLYLVAGALAAELWQPGKEVTYLFHSQMDVSTMYPVETASQWGLKGKLVVQGGDHAATLQLQDLKVTTHNGERAHISTANYTASPEHASQLSQPFNLNYEEGQLVGLSVKAGEDVWAVNIKRGIASLLQLDLAQLGKPAFVAQENGLYGSCTVEYSVTNNDTVRKFVDVSSCSGYAKHSSDSPQRISCSAYHKEDLLTADSVRTYILQTSDTGHILIKHVEADGGIHVQPFRATTESHFLWSRITLELQHEGDISSQILVKGGGEQVNMTFDPPGVDISQGRSIPSQTELIRAVMNILHEIVDRLDDTTQQLNLTLLHEERLAHMLYFMSLLNKSSLSQLYSDLAVGTSYQHETMRNIFLEIIPIVGSHDAMLLVRDIATGGSLKNDTAISLLETLPFNVIQPSEQLLLDFEILLTLPKDSVLYSTAILSFATLVNKVCGVGCAPHILEKYVNQYLGLFTESTDYDLQMLYLEALYNFNLERVADFFTPIIRGDNPKYSHHIRFLAIKSVIDHAGKHPDQKYALYWPLLTNKSEHLEIRVAAFTMLMLSQPTVPRFYNLFLYMLGEKNPHLQHFWYTSLHSLVRANYPCYDYLGSLARKVIRFVPKPVVQHYATGNYIFDYGDIKHDFGFLVHLVSIASEDTGLPSIVHFDSRSHAMGIPYNQLGLYLKLVGVGDVIKQQVMSLSKQSMEDMMSLIQLFSKLKLPMKKSEPLHVEVIVSMENKIILARHFDETNINNLFEVLSRVVQAVASGGIHVNTQDIHVPMIFEEKRATDLGTTALLRVSATWLVSTRANLTTEPDISTQLDLRSLFSYQMALTQYNPILNMWHGVQRALNIQANLPFNLDVSLNPSRDRVVLTHQHVEDVDIGINMHVCTMVFVRGIAATAKLRSHCSRCPAQIIVKTPSSNSYALVDVSFHGMRFEILVRDINDSFNLKELTNFVENKLQDYEENSKMSPDMSVVLAVAHAIDYLILVPPTGSHGVLIGAFPTERRTTQITLRFNKTDTIERKLHEYSPVNFKIEVDVTNYPANSSASNWTTNWTMLIENSHSQSMANHNLTTVLTTQSGLKMCMNNYAEFSERNSNRSVLSSDRPHRSFMHVTSEWGLGDDEECPASPMVKIDIDSATTPQQISSVLNETKWPYKECKKDLLDVEQWGKHYTPFTPACHEIEVELSTLRSYNATIETKLPSWLQLEGVTIDRNISLQLHVPQHGQPVITVNNEPVSSDDFEEGDLDPFLVNTQFSTAARYAVKSGVVDSCVVSTRTVWTFDGLNTSVGIKDCYILASADCSAPPSFAMFLKKVEATNFPLAVKLLSGNSILELVPTAHSVHIQIDDEFFSVPITTSIEPSSENKHPFKVSQSEDGVLQVHMEIGWARLEYYGHFIVLVLPSLYRGQMCGLCGNHDGSPLDDEISSQFSLDC